ncbi:GntR family transcriptional regulator [Arthrobacter rhombi]|uniref:Predicted transcriptional regulator of N-Acetylglucosamine utilization, GntR family n=1 Tax=Arthrobacter rhombi TaxID=71253 RepID=A0A1R4FXW1_9MICC|nr:GntR family transcriptional regulator [Arthrobacter rhombi]SJM60552.1 Predicted transcriptional regulator of N-Acetylglucosamine utilization, GntR family [Arthrobacter rhombi]
MMATGQRDRSGRKVPLWQSVQDQLQERIGRGEFADGFPGEMALADEYEVSRSTIRSALAPLRRAGLLSAQRGRQSSVVNVVDEQRFGPVYSLFAAVENAGMTQRSVVEIAELRRSATAAAHLGLDADADLVFISRTRYADRDVIAVDDTWLPANVAAPVLGADLSHTALYEVLRRKCSITLSAGHETLHALAADAQQSRRLACPAGTAVFFIERLGLAGEQAVEWRETLIRGDRFTVTTSYPAAPAAGR